MRKKKYQLCILVVIVLLLAMISLHVGVYDIYKDDGGMKMLFLTRIPRTIALLLTGAAMSISGLVMQTLTQNKMVEPTTTGTIEWASLGLLLVSVIFPAPTITMKIIACIVFSFVGTMIFFVLLSRIRLKSSMLVPIIGMMMSAVISAFVNFLALEFQASQIVSNWFVGSFSGIQKGRYEYLFLIIIMTFLIYLYANKLAVASLGKDIAKTLGVNYNRVMLVGTAFISLTVGIVAAVIGNLPFLGLIVPNLISLIRGDHLKENLPYVALAGMATITLCDILSRILIAPFEVPVSLILGTVGCIVFMMILLRERKRGTHGA
ncbi:iron chelate uptake ABC transporter family permease subunit [Sharpea porci]|uniref:ABC transporter permease n=1 Tax=Sharpea porci TaxID=2652286 RepID=UPI002A91CB0D|nr:iron chelate uptake ABC transporter family permease subunit [Sharpea porci]MDY5278392.1 iron chelate uptake ABC transporter family permease subunit [Sharpea porci]